MGMRTYFRYSYNERGRPWRSLVHVMEEKQYKILFEGKILEGFDIEIAKKNLATLLKIGPSKKDLLFSNKRIVIRKNADRTERIALAAPRGKTPAAASFHIRRHFL